MDWRRARDALRFDSGGWRRFAEWGSIYAPEWWKRGSPPVIAAIVYLIGRRQRSAVLRNQEQVRGPRGWWRTHWDAYQVFAEFARSVTESLEQWGPHPKPTELGLQGRTEFEAALAEGRGVVLVTGHFGSWEVGARSLRGMGHPVTLVMAHEPNESAHGFIHDMRTRHGVRVIYSDSSTFAGLPILHALRRGEVVCMQIEPWGSKRGSQDVEFFGRRARFQLGPFAVARLARVPLLPVFFIRRGIRKYDMQVGRRMEPLTPGAAIAAFEETVRTYEAVIRENPAQWLMFEDVWEGTDTEQTSSGPPLTATVRP